MFSSMGSPNNFSYLLLINQNQNRPIQPKMCSLEKRGSLFILTLTGDGEHRLNPDTIATILSFLSEIKTQSTRGSALITISQGKFFSNGFDLAWAQSAGSKKGAMERLSHMVEIFKPIVAALLSLPMLTIAAVTGHAAAAGLLLALIHDYIFMRRDKGVLYMSEIDLGLTILDYFTAMFMAKIGSPATLRDILMSGKKIRGDDAVRMGIVESAHDSEDGVRETSVRLGEEEEDERKREKKGENVGRGEDYRWGR